MLPGTCNPVEMKKEDCWSLRSSSLQLGKWKAKREAGVALSIVFLALFGEFSRGELGAVAFWWSLQFTQLLCSCGRIFRLFARAYVRCEADELCSDGRLTVEL